MSCLKNLVILLFEHQLKSVFVSVIFRTNGLNTAFFKDICFLHVYSRRATVTTTKSTFFKALLLFSFVTSSFYGGTRQKPIQIEKRTFVCIAIWALFRKGAKSLLLSLNWSSPVLQPITLKQF